MTKIYTAWYDINVPLNLAYNKHLYLVKDPDGNIGSGNTADQEIIRGGDADNAGETIISYRAAAVNRVY